MQASKKRPNDATRPATAKPGDAPRFTPIPMGMAYAPAPRYAFEYEIVTDGDAIRQRFEFATLNEMAAFYGVFMDRLCGAR